jgi:hypothetical protein
MNTELLTLEHEYCVRGPCAVLNAAGGVPVADSLEAATDYLEAVVAGFRDLMTTPECSNQATLVFFAAETALALVYASHASVDPAAGKVGVA